MRWRDRFRSALGALDGWDVATGAGFAALAAGLWLAVGLGVALIVAGGLLLSAGIAGTWGLEVTARRGERR